MIEYISDQENGLKDRVVDEISKDIYNGIIVVYKNMQLKIIFHLLQVYYVRIMKLFVDLMKVIF